MHVERRAVVTWFHRTAVAHLFSGREIPRAYNVMTLKSDASAGMAAKVMTIPIMPSIDPSPDGAVVVIGTDGEYRNPILSIEAGHISVHCVNGAHLSQSPTPQHCHLPTRGLTPQFG